jgi:hypothetical protein
MATTALCLAVALGAMSHVRGVLVGRFGARATIYVRSEYGKLAVLAHPTDWCEPRRWTAATWPLEPGLSPGIGGWWWYGGFAYSRGGTSGGMTIHQVVVP